VNRWNDPERAEDLARITTTMTAPLLTWLAVHGNLCLALRHPDNRGASRTWVIAFVKALGQHLVSLDVLTADELAAAEKLEAEEGTTDLTR